MTQDPDRKREKEPAKKSGDEEEQDSGESSSLPNEVESGKGTSGDEQRSTGDQTGAGGIGPASTGGAQD